MSHRSALLVLSLTLTCLLPVSLPAQTDDDRKAVGEAIDHYLDAYARKDFDRLTSHLIKTSHFLEAMKKETRTFFRRAEDIRHADVRQKVWYLTKDSAWVDVRLERKWRDQNTGREKQETQNLSFLLNREDRRWKIWLTGSSTTVLAIFLSEAKTKEQRLRLLQRKKELVGEPLFKLFSDSSGRAVREGRLAEAERYETLAAEVAEQIGTDALRAESHLLRSLLRAYQNRFSESLEEDRQALALFRTLRDKTGEAKALTNMAIIYHALGQFPEALKAATESLSVLQQAAEAKTADSSRLSLFQSDAFGLLGKVYQGLGRHVESLEASRKALKGYESLGDRPGEIANIHNSLGVTYVSMGQYGDALREYMACVKIAEAEQQWFEAAQAWNNLGEVYHRLDRPKEARDSLVRGRTLFHRVQSWSGEALAQNNLGVLYYEGKEYQTALQCFHSAREAMEKAGNRSGQLSVQINIALLQETAGQLPQAEQTLRGVVQRARQWQMPGLEAIACINLGVLHLTGAKLPEAQNAFESALAIAQAAGDVETVRKAYYNLGSFYRHQRKWREAVEAYQKAAQAVEQLRRDTREPFLALSLFQQSVSPYYLLAHCQLEQKNFSEAFAAGERAKARALMDVLLSGKADVHKGMSDEQRRQEQQLQGRLTALAVEMEAVRKTNLKRRDELAEQLAQARQDHEAFRRQLYLRLPELRTRRAEFAPATLVELNRSLFADHPKLVVLSYLVTDKEILLFALTRGERPDGPAALAIHKLEVEAEDLAYDVNQFRGGCEKSGAGTPDGSGLYRLLLAPVEEALAEASHVVIVPDGVLHILPFHALKDEEEGKYLIQRCAVSYAPSATALLKMAESGRRRREANAAAPGSLLALAVSDSGRGRPVLPDAEREANRIVQLFGERGRFLLGRAATKARLKAAWANAHYLHFATHGELNEDAPLYSALVLSQSDGGGDEGLLFGRDLLDAELTAELVVLSACQTGLGRQQRGEGLLGMTWAWFVAGVPSTIASQWSVADDSTARFMQVFYTELKGGAPKAEALRRAQLVLLKNPPTCHPRFWAPFALTGDPW